MEDPKWNFQYHIFVLFFLIINIWSIALQDSPDLAVSEMEDYGTLDGMKVGLVATGELGPFSSTKLEIIWQPHIPGRVDTEFLITFSDPLSDSVSVDLNSK